jgi:hypothetical protein
MRSVPAQPSIRGPDAVPRRHPDDPADYRRGEAARHFRARPHHRGEGRACELEGFAVDLRSGSTKAMRCSGFKSALSTFLVSILICALPTPGSSVTPMRVDGCRCQGCGCKGGPGWRDIASKQCVSYQNLAHLCGDPPDNTRCRLEQATQVCPSERGCGGNGGSGWRDKDGHCVASKRLRQVCGNPPETSCTFEGSPKP